MKKYTKINAYLITIFGLLVVSFNASGQSAEYQERDRFFSEARKYESSVLAFTVVYDPKLMSKMSSTYYPPTDAAKWNEVMADLAELDVVCKKYPNMKNPGGRQPELAYLPKSWCEIAANRIELRKKAVQVGAEYELRTRTQNRIYDMENAMRNSFESVLDDYQMLAFEPDAYRQKMAAELQAEYAKRGAQLPTDFFDKYAEIGPKMKTLIEQSIATRTWTMPTIKDATLESLMRGQYAKSPAVSKATVLKVGFVAAGWASVDELTWLSTTGNVSLYRVHPGAQRFKRGYVLVKMPNRPECQAREFVLRQDKRGGGFGATKVEDLGAGGIFVKCP